MAENEVNITYETLFEILRLEKNRVELQKLEKNFYINVAVYIKEKTKALSAEKSFDSRHELAIKQLSNIKKIVRDIYFRRLKKIMNTALNFNVAPDSVVEREPMLEQEAQFFKDLQLILKDNKQNILDMIIKGELLKVEMPKGDISNSIMVRFVDEVPKFVGEDLEEYGPYQVNELANLPTKLADILLSKGSAERADEN